MFPVVLSRKDASWPHDSLYLFLPFAPPSLPGPGSSFESGVLLRNKTGLGLCFPTLLASFFPCKPELEVQHPLGEMRRSWGGRGRIRAIYASEEVQWKSTWHMEAQDTGPLRSPSIPLCSHGQVVSLPKPSLTDDLTVPTITSCHLLGQCGWNGGLGVMEAPLPTN